MVYCGKPSGSCHACRERKTRCDQRSLPDGCTQCSRAKRKCPGYRALGDLIFKNENVNVREKHKAMEARATAKHTALETGCSTPSSAYPETLDENNSNRGLEIVRRVHSQISGFSVAPSIEDQATAFFVTNYVINTSGPTRGYLEYLSTIYNPSEDTSLLAAMKAVGIAGLAHYAQEPALLNQARYHYLKAIQDTNAALKSPVMVKRDSTLSAIMILSIYETVTGSNSKSIRDWAEHVRGAAALLKLRGREQLETPRGRNMFVQVVSTLMISCIQRNAPLPDFIIDWIEDIRVKNNFDGTAFLSQHTMMVFTQFRAGLKDGSISEPEDILARALKIDRTLVRLYTLELPNDWAYKIFYTDQNLDITWNGRYHVYHDYWVAQVWNGMRTIRIMLNETIRSTLVKGLSASPPRFTLPEYKMQFQLSTDVIYEMQADILATVPQHLGCVSSPGDFIEPSNGSELLIRMPWKTFRNSSNDDFPMIRMSGPHFMLWPLWFAGIMDIATKEVRQFVVRNLKEMGRRFGIRQAEVLAAVIENQNIQDISSW